jgi:hypothetical protein
MNATHEYKQVGRNCLADFIGFDPHGAAEYAELMAGIGAFAGACEDGEGAPGERSVFYRTISAYLPFVAMTIRINGWLSKGKAWEQFRDVSGASAVVAWNQMMENERKASKGLNIPQNEIPTEADCAVAAKTISYCAELFEDADVAKLTDYEHNLRVALMAGVVENRTAGIIASAVNFASRDQEKKAERVDFSKSEFVGEIGKRAIFTGLKCVFNAAGGGRPVVFVDPNGNKVSAWNPGFPVEKGQTYNVKATPVKQDEYNGVKSTMLNRMVLATEADMAPKAPRKARAKKEVVNA